MLFVVTIAMFLAPFLMTTAKSLASCFALVLIFNFVVFVMYPWIWFVPIFSFSGFAIIAVWPVAFVIGALLRLTWLSIAADR